MMYEYQNHLTEPPMPIGGYLPKTISDEELKKIIKYRTEMCIAILNGEERPQGKWIFHKDFNESCRYGCNQCGNLNNISSNFCPNCGADMRGDIYGST